MRTSTLTLAEVLGPLYLEFSDMVERYTSHLDRKARGAEIKNLRSRVGNKIRKTNKVRKK